MRHAWIRVWRLYSYGGNVDQFTGILAYGELFVSISFEFYWSITGIIELVLLRIFEYPD